MSDSNANCWRRNVLKSIGSVGVGISLAGCSNDTGEDAPQGEQVEEVTLATFQQGVDGNRYEWGQLVAQSLRELGFEVNFNPMDADPLVDMTYADTEGWHFYTRRAADGFDPGETHLRSYFHSDFKEGGMNVWNIDHPELDELLDEQARVPDENERQEVVYEIQELMAEHAMVLPFMNQVRPQPFNSSRFSNPQPMLEDGLGSFWTFVDIEPDDDVDTLRFSYAEDITKLNPLDPVSRPDREILNVAYDRLLRVEPDNLELVPSAAESVDVIDETTIELSLREGMTFHDGEPVTAQDIEFTFNYMEEHSPPISTRLQALESVNIDSDLDLTINLSVPEIGPFQFNALSYISIIPEHIWRDIPEEVDAEEPFAWSNPEPVGSGPFEINSFVPGEELRMSRFGDHFIQANVENIQRVPVANDRAAVNLFEEGSIDMITSSITVDDVRRFEDLDFAGIEDSAMASVHTCGPAYDRTPTNDYVIRRAVGHAIPRQEIMQAIFGGYAQEIHNPIARPFGFWYNDQLPEEHKYQHSLEAAREILEAGGYEWDSDGRLHYPPDYTPEDGLRPRIDGPLEEI